MPFSGWSKEASEDVHWMGDYQAVADAYGMTTQHFEDERDYVYWNQEPGGGSTKWCLEEDGEYYHQHSSGVFWTWPEWEAAQSYFALGSEEQKELADAYAAYKTKMRTFTESRNLVQARNQTRGFYPMGKKGFGKGKGKGKNKKGKTSSVSSTPSPSFCGYVYWTPPTFAAEALAVNVNSPSYTGCFMCGDLSHSYQHCPLRIKGKGKGSGKVFMLQISEENAPGPQTPLPGPRDVTSLSWEIPDQLPCLESSVLAVVDGYGVLDATESVSPLKFLDFIVTRRQRVSGAAQHVQVVPGPSKTFRFGNGSSQVSESYVLLTQKLGGHSVSLGLYTIDSTGVPLLIGIRTLEKLGAVVDCSRGALVLKTIDDALIIHLKRSAAGHLLLDMCSPDWLQGDAKIFYSSCVSSEANKKEESVGSAFVVMPNEVEVEQPVGDREEECLVNHVDVAYALTDHEWSQLSDLPEESVGEWLADAFAVRINNEAHGGSSRPLASQDGCGTCPYEP